MKISVVIRSHNDAEVIGRTLEMLCRQKLPAATELELLSFDDGSTDATPEIIAAFPQVRSVPGDGGPYNPGRVLNHAVAATTGDMIVFNNSDAVPQRDDYLAALVRPLADPAVGAVYANQLPRPDAFALVRKDHLRAFGDGREAAKWRHFFSLAASACRAEVARQFPFDPAFRYSEDIDWSWRLRRAGLRLVYVPEAAVEHSHNYPPAQLAKRFYNEGIANGQLYGERPSFGHFLLATANEMRRDAAFLAKEREWRLLPAGLRYRWIQRFSSYAGERDFSRGKERQR